MTNTSPREKICYQLQIQCLSKPQMIECLTAMELTNFVEGSVECAEEIEFDYDDVNRDYYGEQDATGPIVFFDESRPNLDLIQQTVTQALHDFGIQSNTVTFSITPIPDQNWRESWKASFTPVFISDSLVLLPPWEDQLQYPHALKIVLEPGMAFGTGQHETTQLCLEMFLDLPVPARTLDVGMGSGILAIAAGLRGCKGISGCDVDPDSVAIANENATRNHVPWASFTDTLLSHYPETKYDLVFANIQMAPLTKLMFDIVKRSSNKIIFSGILIEEQQAFLDLLKAHNLIVEKIVPKNHWLGVQCRVET